MSQNREAGIGSHVMHNIWAVYIKKSLRDSRDR